jgi:hypothetical protein
MGVSQRYRSRLHFAFDGDETATPTANELNPLGTAAGNAALTAMALCLLLGNQTSQPYRQFTG